MTRDEIKASIEGITDQVRTLAGEVGDTVRARVQDRLLQAAARLDEAVDANNEVETARTGAGVMASFGEALEKVKQGKKAQRAGWDGDKWVALASGGDLMTETYLYLHMPDGKQVPWSPDHADLLAENWEGA